MEKKNSNAFSRRNFIRSVVAASAGLAFAPTVFSCAPKDTGSTFGGVPIGVITYSWRNVTLDATEIVQLCKKANITSLELMGNVAEAYAGIPEAPARLRRGVEHSEEVKAAYREAKAKSDEERLNWRLNAPMDKYEELGLMYKDAGINVHTVKFAPAGWSDAEIDYAFAAAKIIGAKAITNEIGDEACRKLGKFAEKHGMIAAYHNHGQPGQPGFNFEEFLAHSPANMLNLDVGHYFGATGKHPNEIIEKLHDRIYSIHLKDKTGKDSDPANTNLPWGEGETPLGDILNLVKDKKWPIYADIELEYKVPEDSDVQQEIIKCVEYCKNILS